MINEINSFSRGRMRIILMNLIPVLLFLVFSGFSYHSEDELVLRAIKKDDAAMLRKLLTKRSGYSSDIRRLCAAELCRAPR
ncbi:MAG: hypothetical protein U5L09_05180 [Bacteroidales bacterium]|nr:hypothetical protein [Bacteroidales bacterium]